MSVESERGASKATSDGKGGGRIVVELDKSTRARSFDRSGSFFGSEITRVLGILEQDVRSLPDRSATIDVEEQMLNARDVICVYGSRGAGKTSFLRSVGRRLRDERDDLHVLPLLDPTLIERNEVFLATIVSNVLAAIERGSRRHGGFSPLAGDALAHNERLREALDALARAFRLLAPGGIKSSWGEAMVDPHLFAHEVLQDAASGRELAVRFHAFIAEAAKAIGVRAFVQPLDDVDTAYGQGWHVLETTRKYLSTRIFIPMISGDLDLYRMLVRSNQIEHVRGLMQFEQTVGGPDGSRSDLQRYRRQIDQLEEQYLLKVMPAERRVRLRSVRERIWDKAGNGEEFLELDSGRLDTDRGRRRPLSEVFAEYCRDVFGWRRFGAVGAHPPTVLDPREWAIARLLPARTRSLISLFQAMVDWISLPARDRRRPVDGLARIFRQALVTRDVDDDLLDELVQGHGLGRLGAWALRRRGEVAQVHMLDPERLRDLVDAEEWTQTVLTINAALFQRWRRDPGSALRFGTKVVQPALVAENGGEAATARRVISAIALEANEPAYRTATRQQAFFVSASKDPQGRSPGLIWLPRRTVKDHKVHLLQAWMRHLKGRGLEPDDKDSKKDTTDLLPLLELVKVAAKGTLSDKEPDVKAKQEMARALFVSWTSFRNKSSPNLRLLLDWFGMTLTLTGGSQLTYLSVDRGLAAIGDLLERASRVDTNAQSSAVEAAVRRFIRETLRDAAAFAPSLNTDNVQPADPTTDEDDELLAGAEASEEVPGLSDALVEWAVCTVSDSNHSAHALPPYVFARVVTRWWANVEKLNDSDTIAFRTAGGMLHRWLAAFLHAHLIEEVKLLGGGPQNFRTNATDVGLETDSFEKNLDALLPTSEGSDVSEPTRPVATAIWMTCPLIRACLAPELRKKISDVSNAVLGTSSAWSKYLAKDEPGSSDARIFQGRLDRPQLKIHGDVQVLLTALYAPEARKGEAIAAGTYESGRARLAELSGLDFANIEQPSKPGTQSK